MTRDLQGPLKMGLHASLTNQTSPGHRSVVCGFELAEVLETGPRTATTTTANTHCFHALSSSLTDDHCHIGGLRPPCEEGTMVTPFLRGCSSDSVRVSESPRSQRWRVAEWNARPVLCHPSGPGHRVAPGHWPGSSDPENPGDPRQVAQRHHPL